MILNTTQTILLIVIILLAGYIIFLQMQLVRKNILIESIARKVSGLERALKPDELKKFISELHSFNVRASLADDKLFEDKLLGFIIDDEANKRTYIHYTMDEQVALNILSEGFKFVDSFYKTAIPVSNDKLDLLIKHNNKKFYGDYIIVICIAYDIVRLYSDEIENAGIKNYSFENILTEAPPSRNENSEITYLLPSQYIKGYINYRTGEVITNPVFNPAFTSPGFTENIKRLKRTNQLN
jgi:hypothetical protein